MKKRNIKLASLVLTAIIAVSNPMSLYAMTVEEDPILRGTGDESTIIVDDLEYTIPQEAVVVAEEVEEQGIHSKLTKAMTYLRDNVTNPVVNTVGGEWSVLTMARYGNLSEETKQNYMTNLYRVLEENKGVLDKRKYTEYARVVLALSALGVDPTNVNGYNLLYPLADFQKVNWQGINGTIYALIALDSHDYEIPKLTEEDLQKGIEQTTRQKLIQKILEKQLSDGGWSLSGTEADADMTSMAIQALYTYVPKNQEVKEAVNRAVHVLSEKQNEAGGFSSFGTENLESAAQAVIALSAFDVKLLSDERFIKNGKSILDYLLSYQLEDGSFKHTAEDEKADAMSTDQGTMALLAYERAINGKTALFDMTDVKLDGTEEETKENVERFRKKIETLPTEIRIKDQQTIYALLSELDQMKKFTEKEIFRVQLQEKLEEISAQIKIVDQLSEQIWKKINPLQVTLKDTETIEQLMETYQNVPKENLIYVKHAEDLLQADVIVKKLQKGILGAEIFTNVKNSSVDYVYETWNYTWTLKGENAYEPADMKASVSSRGEKGKFLFTTRAEGKLPGSVELHIQCNGFVSKTYTLYKWEDGQITKAGTAFVEGGYLTCEIEEGGIYYIENELENLDIIEPVISGTQDLEEVAEQVYGKSETVLTLKKKEILKTEDEKTVKAEVKDNIVAKEELSRVKDQDRNLRMEGKMEDGTVYAFTLNGKDVKEEKDICIKLQRTSVHDEEIKQLAEYPAVLHFAQSGSFPGVIQVEVSVEKEDGEYLLLYYNPKEQKAEYVQKIEIKEGQTKFLIEKGGTYFIDKKASTKSLKDNKTEEGSFIDTNTDEIILQGTKNDTSMFVTQAAIAFLIVTATVLIWIGYRITRKKREDRGSKGHEET